MPTYTKAPSPDACEWPGQLIGISNTITREKSTCGQTADIRKDFDTLRESAIRSLSGYEAHVHDSIFAGLRVRLFSNSHHLADFWQETTWAVNEWREKTGLHVGPEIDLTIDAIINRPDLQTGAFLNEEGTHLLLINHSWFGDLKRHASEIIFPALMKRGILPVRGSAIVRDDKAHLLLGASGSGKTTTALAALAEGGQWMADQWLGVRFGKRMKDERIVLFANPDELEEGPDKVAGFSLNGEPREISRDSLHTSIAPTAHIFPLERKAYIPAELAEHDLELVPALFRSRLENIPGYTDDLRYSAENNIEQFRKSASSQVKHFLGYMPRAEAERALSRFLAGGGGRAVLDPETRFGKNGSAMCRALPARVSTITILVCDQNESTLMNSIETDFFLRLMATAADPDGHPEIFGNSTRSGDFSSFVQNVSAQEYLSEDDFFNLVPEPLKREAGWFALLGHAARKYRLNTSAGKPEACAGALSEAMHHRPANLHLAGA
jgi:hypothetical protein